MRVPEVKRTSCDILIIGGGVAGCYAAVKAKEENPSLDILLMAKAAIRRSGAAARGMDAMNVVVIPGYNTVEQYVESVRAQSMGVFDEAVTRRIAEDSYAALRQLEEWGVEFPRDSEGRYIMAGFHPKGSFIVEMRGDDFKPILAGRVERSGARVAERTMATRLLTSEGRVTGVIGFNVRDGSLLVVSAKAVILSCGGADRVGLPATGYLHGTFNCPYSAGDGYSMALRAGAELVNLEYTATSAMTKDFNGPGLSTFIRHGGVMVNALGEEFLARYSPDLKERAPAGIRYQAARQETIEGRGPIYFRLSHLPEEKIKLIEEGIFTVERPTTRDYLEAKGVDMRRDDVEVILTETYLEGGHGMTGLRINDEGETNIPGLYAAGDVAANPFGFLTAALVFGAVAARNAAKHVEGKTKPILDEAQVKEEIRRVSSLTSGEIEPSQFEYKTRRVVNEYVQPPKSETRLKNALKYVEKLRRDESNLHAGDPHTAMKAFEACAILDCVEMTTLASLERRESRWGLMHQRVDYPKRDDANWLGYVAVYMGSDHKIRAERKPLKDDA
jgi:succinate dehydrogenase/fumarate reductase flavoprotein subunit